uniref:Bulb-type lectin domain-containing protein n=1 Tax=Oncorhynchus kisutch TaxID=8019 RepID=A0A8C7CMK0_ONCKI
MLRIADFNLEWEINLSQYNRGNLYLTCFICKLIFSLQTDGNFVLYGWGRVVWASNTEQRCSEAHPPTGWQPGHLHHTGPSHLGKYPGALQRPRDDLDIVTSTGPTMHRGHLTLTDEGTLELYRDQEMIWTS